MTRWHCLQNVDFDDDEDDLNMEEEECKSPNALLYYFYLPKSSKLIKKKRIQRTVGMLPDLEFIIYVVLLVFFFDDRLLFPDEDAYEWCCEEPESENAGRPIW